MAVAQDDETHPACGEAVSSRDRQLAGLKPRRKGDPPLNPEGKNGREGAEAWRKFLDEQDEEAPNKVKRRCMHEAVYAAILAGEQQAQKLGMEQDQGKARQQIDVTSDNVPLNASSAAIGLVDAIVATALAKLGKSPNDPAK